MGFDIPEVHDFVDVDDDCEDVGDADDAGFD